MTQRGCRTGLTPEAFEELWIVRQIAMQDLDSNVSLEREISRLENGCRTTATDVAHESIPAAELVARSSGSGRPRCRGGGSHDITVVPRAPYAQYMAKQQRLIVAALLSFGVGMLVLAALSGGGNDDDISVTGNPAIDGLIPERESEILRRDQIGIDLAEGFAAALTIETSDGRTIPIPSDQLDENFQDNLGKFLFKPGDNKVLDVFPPQSNCVTATYWPIIDRESAQTIRWCFQVT